MNKQNFLNESMDYKKMFLCLLKKTPWLLAATIAGAILCGALYLAVRTVSTPTRYSAESKFLLTFVDGPAGVSIHYYNGYTWNDILHSDVVLDQVIAVLEGMNDNKNLADKDVLRDDLFEGRILSDPRLLTISCQTDDREKTAILQQALESGLFAFIEELPAITAIELYTSTQPALVVWDNYLSRAIIGGAVLFLLVSLFVWWFSFILDDSLYTVADAEKRYPFTVLGILLKGETLKTANPYFAEVKENLSYVLNRRGGCPHPPNYDDIVFLSIEAAPYPDPATLREAAGVVLEVPYGQRNGKKIDRCVSFLQTQDVEILGLLITEADQRVLNPYYGNTKNS
jgi:capsular polysaccharide biosynthesis protein